MTISSHFDIQNSTDPTCFFSNITNVEELITTICEIDFLTNKNVPILSHIMIEIYNVEIHTFEGLANLMTINEAQICPILDQNICFRSHITVVTIIYNNNLNIK